jgi:ribonuclease HI
MKYYTDGSSTIGIKSAHCVVDEKGRTIEYLELKAPNDKTNNEEEYRGVIAALKYCKEGDEIFTDSMLVVNQVNGGWKCNKPHLVALRNETQDWLIKTKAILRWIPREENLAGKIFE